MSDQPKTLKKFDLVEGQSFALGVIISDPFTAYFPDIANKPIDITNPGSYDYEADDMVLVYVYMPSSKGVKAMRLVNLSPAEFDLYNAYVPADYAREALYEAQSLTRYADDVHQKALKEKHI